MRGVLVEALAVGHVRPGRGSLMFKSREAKAWEAKVQNLIDLVVMHNDEATRCCKAGDHKREERHAAQVDKMMIQLVNLTIRGAIPAGAKLPKLPKIK